MNRLDGQKTGNGRDNVGRFAPGNTGGPGRPRRETERAYLAVISEACPLETWREIVLSTVANAQAGDRYAREWLSAYLVGRPEGAAVTLHTLAVEETVGSDPVDRDATLEALLPF